MTFHLNPSISDDRMVNLVSFAAVEVLQAATGIESKFHALTISPTPVSTEHICIILNITGENTQSDILLSFPLSLATQLVSRFLNITLLQLTPEECNDGICELANMIAGRIKTTLSETTGYFYRLSVPTIILGNEPDLFRIDSKEPRLTLIFEAEEQQFQIKLCLKSVT